MKYFSEKDCLNLAKKLFQAVSYIHAKGIAHRDLKPENILFATLDEDSDIKISDFGFAGRVSGPKERGRRGTLLGTKGYAAPEVFSGSYDQKCDVWSLGVIIYIMLCGVPPFVEFGDDDQPEYTPFWIYQNKMQSVPSKKVEFPPRFWKQVSTTAQEFLAAILEVDPEKRLTAADALKHSWFNPSGPPVRAKSNLLSINSAIFQKTVQAIQASDYRTINRAPFVPGLDATIKEKMLQKYDVVKAKQIMTWIEDVVGVKAKPGESLQDFLKDGVHLCNLVNKIQPGTIKKIGTSKSAFVMMENIANFLKAAKDIGVRQEDLFVTVNLFEATDMVSVLNTLFNLGVKAKGIKTFSGPYLSIAGKTEKETKEKEKEKNKSFVG